MSTNYLRKQKTTLSEREQDVTARIAAGITTNEISAALGVSADSVRGTIRRASEKLGLFNRKQLIEWVRQQA